MRSSSMLFAPFTGVVLPSLLFQCTIDIHLDRV